MKTRVWRQYKGSACGGSRLLIQSRRVAAATQLQDFRRRRKSCKLSEAVCRRRKAAACRQSGAAAKRRRTAHGFAEAGRTVQKRLVGFCRSAYRTNSDGRFQKKTRSLALPKPDFLRTSRREHGGAGAPDGGQAGHRKRSAARKPLSVCGLRHLCFSAVREPPASFRQRRKSCAVTRQ